MKKKEQRFFQAALEYHKENSMKGDRSIYHSASFLAEDPDWEYARIEPKEFDENFYYNTKLLNAKKDELRSAMSVQDACKNAVYWEIDNLDPSVFTMAGARPVTAAFITRKTPRASSMPPDSATARAKMARTGEGSATATPKPKPRAKSIPSSQLAKIANTIYQYIKDALPKLLPRHYTKLRTCARGWYNQLYHTGYKVTTEEFLDLLHTQETSSLMMREGPGEETDRMKQALVILEAAMNNLKVSLNFDPAAVSEPASAASGQSSQSHQESEDTEAGKSTDEPSALAAKGRKVKGKTRR